MRKLKLLFAACALLLGAGQTWAETDVTSTYLTNADFEGTYSSVYTINTDRYVFQPNGWTVDYVNISTWNMTVVKSTDAMASNFTGTYAVPQDNNKYMVRFRDNQPTEYVDLSQTITVTQAGLYTFSADLIREDGSKINVELYAGDNSVSNTTAGAWETRSFSVNLEANTEIKVGIKFTNKAATGVKAGADNVKITYSDPLEFSRSAWEEAKAAAEAAAENTDYSNVSGSERATLEAEIAKAEPSTAEGYDGATAALTTATQTFVDAKKNYDIFENYNQELVYADPAKEPIITDESTAASIITALRAYYESNALAEGVEGAVDQTSKLTNPINPTNTSGWTIKNTNGNSSMRIMSNEPYTNSDGTTATGYFDSNSWGSAFATTFTQDVELPAGKYILSAKARGNGTTTYQLTANGVNTDITSIGNTGGVFDRGWNDYTVEFTINEITTVTLGMNIVTGSNSNWLSFGDFRLVRLELYTEMADAGDYSDMASALTAAKGKALGFETGEFAPYNNVEAINAIATAEAINTDEENAKDEIMAITTALTTWTANTEEVNAIYDGQFANTEANTTSGDIDLPGWTKVEGIRLLVKDQTNDPGLAYTDGKAAVFSWGGTTLTYGEQTGYTLPMSKNSIYELTFKASGWRDGDTPTWISVTLDGVTQEGETSVPGRINDAEGNPFSTYTYYLKPTEDNSILKIYMNKHFAIADLSMKLAVAENVTIDEAATAAPEYNYANVTLTRTLSASYWNTFSVPFDAAIPSGWTVKEYDGENSDNNVIAFKNATTIKAGVPYLVKPTSNVENPTFDGVTVEKTEGETIGTGDYKFVAQIYNKPFETYGTVAYLSTDGSIKKLTSGGLKGLRAYFIIPAESPGARIAFIDEGTTTGIAEMKEMRNEKNENVYDLSGRRVKALNKGIYVVNGKKIVK